MTPGSMSSFLAVLLDVQLIQDVPVLLTEPLNLEVQKHVTVQQTVEQNWCFSGNI